MSVMLGLLPVLARAVELGDLQFFPGASSPTGSSATYELLNIIVNILNFAFILLGGLSVVVIVYAAFMFLFAGGNPEKAKTARNYVTYVLVATAVAALSLLAVKIIIELVVPS